MKLELKPTVLFALLAVCGDYRISGKLVLIRDGGTVLEAGSGTANAQRVIISSLPADDRLNFEGQYVRMRVRVNDVGDEKQLPRGEYLGGIEPASPREEAKTDFVVLLKKSGRCH